MSHLLDQQPNGSFNVITEDGKVVSKGPMSRTDAYAFIDRLERNAK
jgi:hypothetical protein